MLPYHFYDKALLVPYKNEIGVGNTRLTPIKKGKVPCVHVETLKKATCAFRPDSGDWIVGLLEWWPRLGEPR